MQRVLPLPGDVVWIRQRRWRVERARADRGIVRLDVQNRDGRLTFLAPVDGTTGVARPQRPIRVRPQQALARLASIVSRTTAAGVPAAALGAHIEILPHQLEPLAAILDGHRRVLIADEVGLGKTIQAGLILAELQRRDSALRAMVIVPATLRDQWAAELADRFAVQVHLADRAGVEEAGRRSVIGESAWQRAGIWLASPDYLKQQHVLRGLPASIWDLVVIDEAHDACGASERHDACTEIARSARRLILLTATPHNGDETRYERLIEMGNLPGYHRNMVVFRRTRADVSLPARRRTVWQLVQPSAAERGVFDTLQQYEQAVLASGRSEPGRLLLLSVFRKRALSTALAFARSLSRRTDWLNGTGEVTDGWQQGQLAFDAPRDEWGLEEQQALATDSGLATADELTWLRRLQSFAGKATRHESKLRHIAGLASRTSEPIVIFTEFRESLEAVATTLRPLRPLALLHGSQSAIERRRELQRFLSGEASVLVATDVAGQGLNLQTRARWVLSLELPWDPVRLEQRLGRVDRIGQTRNVHASILVMRHDVESAVIVALARRAIAARQSFGASVLCDCAPPAPKTIAAAIFAGAPLRAETTTELPSARSALCTTFVRRARSLARVLEYKRRLAARWRGPDRAERPIWTSARRLAPGLGSGAGSVAIVSVPFLDDDAALIERQLVAVRFTPDANRTGAPLVSLLVNAAAARLEARRRRLEAIAVAAARGAVELEAALACHVRAAYERGPVQPGLFNQEATRAFGAVRDDLRRLDRSASARMRAVSRTARVHIGRPSLEMLIIP